MHLGYCFQLCVVYVAFESDDLPFSMCAYVPQSQKGNSQVFLVQLEGKKNGICSN